MATTNTEILKVSLKQYKKEIDDLKASLLGLDKESEEYAKTLDELREKQRKLNQVNADTKKDADALEGSYNKLVYEMGELKKAWRATNDESKRNELGAQIEAINTQLKDLDASLGNYQRNVGNYEGATVSLKQQLRELNETMMNMLASGIKETDPAFVELAKKAGRIKDAMMDAKAATKEYANDVRGMAVGIGVVKDLAAGYGAMKSAMHLFGIESKSAQEITAKMTAVMTLLNSLQTINKAINDSSSPTRKLLISLWDKLTGVKQKDVVVTTENTAAVTANKLATDALTTSMEAETVATETATVATNGFKKALIATGIGAIIVAIGTLIAYFNDIVKTVKKWLGVEDDEIKKAKEAAEAQKRHAQAVKDLDFQYNSTTKVVGEINAKFEVLKAKVKAAEGNIRAQIDVVKLYRREWEFLKVPVKNYADLVVKLSGEIAQKLKEYTDVRVAQTKYELAAKRQAEAEYRVERLKAMAKEAEEELNIEHQKEVQKAKLRYEALKKQREENPTMAAATDVEAARKYYESLAGTYKKLVGGVIMTNLKEANAELGKATADAQKYLNEKAKMEAKFGDFSSGGGSTTNSKNTKEVKEETKELTALTTQLNKDLEDTNHMYNVIKASGLMTAKVEKEQLQDVHELRMQYFKDYEAQANKDLQNTKYTADQKKSIQSNLEKVLEDKTKEEHDYEVKLIELRKKIADEAINEIKKRFDQQINQIKQELSTTEAEISIKYDTKNLNASPLDVAKNNRDKNKEIYDARLKAIDDEIAANTKLMESLDKTSEAYKNVEKAVEQLNTKRTQTSEQAANQEAKDNKQVRAEEKKEQKQRLKGYETFANSIINLASAIADAEKARIDAKVKAGKMSEKEAEREFEKVKKTQMAIAIITTLMGATGAFANTMADTTLQPTWLRAAVAGTQLATALATGYAQVNQIKATTYGGSGGSLSSSGMIGVRTQPLLDERLDGASLQGITVGRLDRIRDGQTDQKVYILQSDIADSQKQVEVRETNSTF